MIPVVYEDKWLLVADKPSGLLVIPTPKKEKHTLTSILGLYPCHRLDRETSGLIIYAKGKAIQKRMMLEFKQRRIKKTYIAFVQGLLPKEQGKINLPIEGKPALTEYKVIEARKYFTVVQVKPITGRTNQIRLHFKNIGHPIVGESKFAFRRDFKLKAGRLCLHANALEFAHPITSKLITLTSRLPKALNNFLEKHPIQ